MLIVKYECDSLVIRSTSSTTEGIRWGIDNMGGPGEMNSTSQNGGGGWGRGAMLQRGLTT